MKIKSKKAISPQVDGFVKKSRHQHGAQHPDRFDKLEKTSIRNKLDPILLENKRPRHASNPTPDSGIYMNFLSFGNRWDIGDENGPLRSPSFQVEMSNPRPKRARKPSVLQRVIACSSPSMDKDDSDQDESSPPPPDNQKKYSWT
eukprot:UN33502